MSAQVVPLSTRHLLMVEHRLALAAMLVKNYVRAVEHALRCLDIDPIFEDAEAIIAWAMTAWMRPQVARPSYDQPWWTDPNVR